MAGFCKALGTQSLAGGEGPLPAASWGEAVEGGATELCGSDPSAIARALPSSPRFSLSCRSQLLVDMGSCCCVSVSFALFCFNLSTSFMCLNQS